MPLSISGLAGRGLSREDADAFERAVRDVLPAGEDLSVRFSVWDGDEDGTRRLVCKVESPPCDPLFEGPQWRWWSPLFASAGELRAALEAAVAARRPAVERRDSPRTAPERRVRIGA